MTEKTPKEEPSEELKEQPESLESVKKELEDLVKEVLEEEAVGEKPKAKDKEKEKKPPEKKGKKEGTVPFFPSLSKTLPKTPLETPLKTPLERAEDILTEIKKKESQKKEGGPEKPPEKPEEGIPLPKGFLETLSSRIEIMKEAEEVRKRMAELNQEAKKGTEQVKSEGGTPEQIKQAEQAGEKLVRDAEKAKEKLVAEVKSEETGLPEWLRIHLTPEQITGEEPITMELFEKAKEEAAKKGYFKEESLYKMKKEKAKRPEEKIITDTEIEEIMKEKKEIPPKKEVKKEIPPEKEVQLKKVELKKETPEEMKKRLEKMIEEGVEKKYDELKKRLEAARENLAMTSKDNVAYQFILKDYKESRDALRNFLFRDKKAELEAAGLSERDINENLKIFTSRLYQNLYVDEALKLENRRAEIKSQKKGFWKYIYKIGDTYRKLPLKYKLAASLALAGGAATFGAGSAAIASVFATATIGQRILGGLATTIGLEGLIKRSQEKARQKQGATQEKIIADLQKQILKDIEAESEKSEKADELLKAMDKYGAELDEKLGALAKQEKKEEVRRWVLAGAAGALVGSGLLAKAIGNVIDMVKADVPAEPQKFVLKPGVPPAEVLKVPHEFFTVGETQIEIPSESLEIGIRGPEGAIIDYLKSQGIPAEKAGIEAHRMFLEYMKEHNIANQEEFLEKMKHIAKGGVRLLPGGRIDLIDLEFVKEMAPTTVPAEEILTPEVPAEKVIPESPAELSAEIKNQIADLEREIQEANQDVLDKYDYNFDQRLDEMESHEAQVDLDRIESMKSRLAELKKGILLAEAKAVRVEGAAGRVGELVEGIKASVFNVEGGNVRIEINEATGEGNLSIDNVKVSPEQIKAHLTENYQAEIIKSGEPFYSANRVIMANGVRLEIYQEVLDQLGSQGLADSAEAGFLKRAISQLVEKTEAKYGNVFK